MLAFAVSGALVYAGAAQAEPDVKLGDLQALMNKYDGAGGAAEPAAVALNVRPSAGVSAAAGGQQSFTARESFASKPAQAVHPVGRVRAAHEQVAFARRAVNEAAALHAPAAPAAAEPAPAESKTAVSRPEAPAQFSSSPTLARTTSGEADKSSEQSGSDATDSKSPDKPRRRRHAGLIATAADRRLIYATNGAQVATTSGQTYTGDRDALKKAAVGAAPDAPSQDLASLPQDGQTASAGKDPSIAALASAPVATSTTNPAASQPSGSLLPTRSAAASVTPLDISPTNPKFPVAPNPAAPNTGLIIGTGGLTGSLTQLLGPTAASLFGGDGFVHNGNTAISSANVPQAYTVVNVLGVPVVNLSPVGQALSDLGGFATGTNSHLTVIGGATSGNYITNINNGAAGGVLGLVLPNQAPGWASTCLDLGVANAKCWGVNAAQDYQVLVGDGASANGSKEVVIGTNATHTLPAQTAAEAFPGAGANDPNDPTGVPTSDYEARQGHSVVVGDNAAGTANGQTILGAEATSNQVNSVALGFKSSATRGPQIGYAAFGLAAPQNSAGEVSIGSPGNERQITNVAAGSAGTDAVNVNQLQGALTQIGAVDNFSVHYDADANGNPNYGQITLGNGNPGQTRITNLADGAVAPGSTDAITGNELYIVNHDVAQVLGGGAGIAANGQLTAPTYPITTVAANGDASLVGYHDVGSALNALNTTATNATSIALTTNKLAVKYDPDANGNPINNITLVGSGNGAPVSIINLADGTVAGGSTAAVTGNQLFTANALSAAYLGGGASVGPEGFVTTAPTYNLSAYGPGGQLLSATYHDVGSALYGLDQATVFLGSQVKLGVQYIPDANGNPTNSIILAGSGNGAPVSITNLAPGVVAGGSTAAVNGSQLFASNYLTATYLGGGAALGADGYLTTAPTYNIATLHPDGSASQESYHDVGSAFGALNNTVIGVGNYAVHLNSVAVKYDQDASGNPTNNITLTGSGNGAPVSIINLAPGQIAGGSTAAVNGSQLFASNYLTATFLGGGAALDGNGYLTTAPTYNITTTNANGQTTTVGYHDVGSAFAALDNTVGQSAETDKLAVKYDADANGNPSSHITLTGDGSGAPVGISNLAPGQVAAGSTAAINGSQLFTTNQALASFMGGTAAFDPASGLFTAPTFAITSISANGTTSKGTYNNVTDAFGAVDGSLNNLNTQISNIQNGNGNKYFQVLSTRDGASATGQDSVAVGPQASATGDNGFAAGTGSQALSGGSVAVGQNAVAQAPGAVALGSGSVADRPGLNGSTELFSNVPVNSQLGAVSIGAPGQERQITNVAGGTADTDAVNVRQLRAVADTITQVDDSAVKYDDSSKTKVTLGGASGTKITNVAAGDESATSTDAVNGSQLWHWTQDTTNNLSNTSLYNSIQNISNGGGIKYFHANSSAPDSQATGQDSVAAGPSAVSGGANSVAVGNGATTGADNSVALGSGATVNNANSVALGAGSSTSVGAQQGYTGAYMPNGSGSSAGEVSVGNAANGTYRQITNVADGSAAHDAVNVQQLQAGVNNAISTSESYTNQQLTKISNGGGNANFQVNNTNALAPASAAGNNTAAGGAGSVASGDNSTALGNGAKAQGANSVALGQGSVADRDNTVSVGSAGNERQIANVAAGTSGTDAVNVNQLNAAKQGTVRYDTNSDGSTNYSSITLGGPGSSTPATIHNVGAGTADTDAANVGQLNTGLQNVQNWAQSYTDQRFSQLNRDIQNVGNRANAGVAAAMAMAGLPQAYEPGRSMAAVAGSGFRGESAIAIGVSMISEGGRWVYKLNGSTDSRGDAGVSVGVGMQW